MIVSCSDMLHIHGQFSISRFIVESIPVFSVGMEELVARFCGYLGASQVCVRRYWLVVSHVVCDVSTIETGLFFRDVESTNLCLIIATDMI